MVQQNQNYFQHINFETKKKTQTYSRAKANENAYIAKQRTDPSRFGQVHILFLQFLGPNAITPPLLIYLSQQVRCTCASHLALRQQIRRIFALQLIANTLNMKLKIIVFFLDQSFEPYSASFSENCFQKGPMSLW